MTMLKLESNVFGNSRPPKIPHGLTLLCKNLLTYMPIRSILRLRLGGAKLSFKLSNPDTDPDSPEMGERETLGTIRMSNELLKVMVFLLREQIMARETEYDVQFDVPQWVLDQLELSDLEWDEFWGYDSED